MVQYAIARESNSLFGRSRMGVTTKIPHPKQPISTIIEVADNLLYRAKQAGRNQLAVDNWLSLSQKP